MERFNIAGLSVEMNCQGELIYKRSRPYLSDDTSKTEITIDIPQRVIEEQHKRLSSLSEDQCRYVLMGEYFYHKLLDFEGILLHSSCIEKDGSAYLFSANSGVGKSTHTHLWMKVFKNVNMINDDKPAIRKIGDKYMACGTPFSGKNDESLNIIVPIKAIVFVERSSKNSIKNISPAKAIPYFMSQTIRPSKIDKMDKMLNVADGILKEIPVFILKCNMEDDAATTAYFGIEKFYNDRKV